MALPFSVFLHSSNSLSLIMLKFAPACRRCLSKAANIVRRLSGSYSLPSDLRTSAKNHSRVPFSSCLGISSSLWGSFLHVLHASKRFTHVFVDFVVFLFKFFSLNFCKSSGVAASKMGRVLFRCCGSFSISSMNASALSISSSSSLPVGSLKN